MAADHTPETTSAPRRAAQAVALALSVFGVSLMAPGRFEAQAQAQTLPAGGLAVPGLTLRMEPRVRAEVEAALRTMPDGELGLTYARIHATFREYLGHDDLSVARALIDYAQLAETELRRRRLALPTGTESPERMALAYELVL